MLIIRLLFLSVFFFNAHAANKVGQVFLQYFSSTCPSQGDWTKLVVSDADALINILETLKDDPDCMSVAGSIAQLGGLARKVAQLDSSKQQLIELEKIKAKEIELANQLNTVKNEDVVLQIQEALRQVQIEKSVLLAEQQAMNRDQITSVSDTYSNITLSTNQLYKSIIGNSLCLDKNPRLISTVTSLISSIGSGLSSVNPALGLGLGSVSEFLGQTVEAARVGRVNRKIRKISDGVLMNSGLKCALESLSNRWCDLSDAYKLLNFKFNLKAKDQQEIGLISIVNIYDRKIPALLDWLSKVRAGAPAATETDAIRHEVVYERWKTVQVASSNGDGVLTEYKSRYNAVDATSQVDQFNIIKQVISKLTGRCIDGGRPSSSVPNPLFEIYNNSYAPYRLLGLKNIPIDESKIRINFCEFDPFTQWPNNEPYIPNYNLIETEYRSWIEQANQYVNLEYTQVLQPDALGVLTSAFERTGSKWKISPKESIDEIIVFLNENKPKSFSNNAFSKIFIEIQNHLEIISENLTNALLVQNSKPIDAINNIFKTAQLQFGTVVFHTRLDMVVRLSIDEYFKNLSLADQNIAAQMMAMESYLETLKKVSGKDNDELVMLDIQNAQKGALSNMRSFIEVFSKTINKHIKKIDKIIRKTKDISQSSVDLDDLVKLCVLLSTMPNVSDKIDMKICYGKKIAAMIKDGPETVSLSSTYLQEKFSNRSCAYRDYIRKSKIYREWDIKL